MIHSVRDQVASAIGSDHVVVFMKGSREAPHCGFSAQMVEVLNHLLPNYSTFDVRADNALRQAVKEHSGWPTFPQLYVRGDFIGGCDIVKELFASGALATKLGVTPTAPPDPELLISRGALDALRRIADGHAVRLDLDAQDHAHLAVSEQTSSDIVISVEGVQIVLDVLTASRADGLHIDYLESPGGFVIRRSIVEGVSAHQLRELLRGAQEPPLLVDCRTLAEFQRGSLPGSEHLTQELLGRLASGEVSRKTVFVCSDGARSSNVAEHFAVQGDSSVRYLEGGLDRWRAQQEASERATEAATAPRGAAVTRLRAFC